MASSDAGADPSAVAQQTDPSDDMEGLYLKVEAGGRVLARLKYVRASFCNAILDAGGHWLTRTLVPNQLAPGVDLWSPSATYGEAALAARGIE